MTIHGPGQDRERIGARRPIAVVIAVVIGLGGMATATGMALGAVGVASAHLDGVRHGGIHAVPSPRGHIEGD